MTKVTYTIHHYYSGGKDIGEKTVATSDRFIIQALHKYMPEHEPGYYPEIGVTLIDWDNGSTIEGGLRATIVNPGACVEILDTGD